ncbi:MAG TPA: metallophosphoesterase family protein [Xanthobacteraceae bacterium]|jgi:predicted phosphodiesterase|nr:metallophosphoesterase family protein [Xanthobacteraceae bacterium]
MTLAVIADIHGNLPALEAVLADIARRGVTRIVDLGDCASGPLWPRETCELLMARGYPTVRGNHDRWVATLAPADMGTSDRYTFGALDEAQRRWLGELPASVRLDGNILAVHGRVGDDSSYLLEDIEGGRLVRASADTVAQRLGRTGAALVLCGHSHQQHMMRVPDGPIVLNPGSVGLPAYRDPEGIAHVSEVGSPPARYALIEDDGNAMTIELIALDYDYASAVKRATANGNHGWAHALATGFALPAHPGAVPFDVTPQSYSGTKRQTWRKSAP